MSAFICSFSSFMMKGLRFLDLPVLGLNDWGTDAAGPVPEGAPAAGPSSSLSSNGFSVSLIAFDRSWVTAFLRLGSSCSESER